MEKVLYKSTRSKDGAIEASKAILKGLADDGGLFVPLSIPKLDKSLNELSKMSYQEVAYEVMKLFFTMIFFIIFIFFTFLQNFFNFII